MNGVDMQRARSDFAEYRSWGGRHSFESWLDRYRDDYRTDEGPSDE